VIVRLEETRFVTRPIEEVFEYAADFANIENWDPGVESSRSASDGPVGLGSVYDLMVKFGNSTSPMRYEITAYEPPNRVVIVGTGDKVDAVDEIKFSRADNMTRIDYTADLEFKGLLRFIAPMARGTMRKVGEKALDGLVEALAR
jgi:carbon monoxide dehydrogenase subunit G